VDEFFRLLREWTDLVDLLLWTLPPVDFFSLEIAVFMSRPPPVLSPLKGSYELSVPPALGGTTSSWKLRALCERDVFVVGFRVFLLFPERPSFGSEPIESTNPLSTCLLELFFLIAADDLLDDKALPSSSFAVGSTNESLRRFTLSSPLPLSLYCAFKLFSMSAFWFF